MAAAAAFYASVWASSCGVLAVVTVVTVMTAGLTVVTAGVTVVTAGVTVVERLVLGGTMVAVRVARGAGATVEWSIDGLAPRLTWCSYLLSDGHDSEGQQH